MIHSTESTRSTKLLASLALCAMFWMGLASAVSQWLATSQGITWVELCSANAQTLQLVAVEWGNSSLPEKNLSTDAHCEYCTLPHHMPFVSSVLPSLFYFPMMSNRLSIRSSGASIFKRFIRGAHHSRAPPILPRAPRI